MNQGELPEPMRNSRFAPLSLEDVGTCVATILLNIDAHRNKAYLLTGPESLTGEQQAQVSFFFNLGNMTMDSLSNF